MRIKVELEARHGAHALKYQPLSEARAFSYHLGESRSIYVWEAAAASAAFLRTTFWKMRQSRIIFRQRLLHRRVLFQIQNPVPIRRRWRQAFKQNKSLKKSDISYNTRCKVSRPVLVFPTSGSQLGLRLEMALFFTELSKRLKQPPRYPWSRTLRWGPIIESIS